MPVHTYKSVMFNCTSAAALVTWSLCGFLTLNCKLNIQLFIIFTPHKPLMTQREIRHNKPLLTRTLDRLNRHPEVKHQYGENKQTKTGSCDVAFLTSHEVKTRRDACSAPEGRRLYLDVVQ